MARAGPRDADLLDTLESLEPTGLEASVWRITRGEWDPCRCARGGGRWDDTTFDVLYTSTLADGARAEMYFHLRKGQPVVPSKPVYRLYELTVAVDNLLDLTDGSLLASLGVDVRRFGAIAYGGHPAEYLVSQAIGEAANFLGHDGVLVPNARWPAATNLVLFCDQASASLVGESEEGDAIDWNAWAKRIGA